MLDNCPYFYITNNYVAQWQLGGVEQRFLSPYLLFIL